MINVFLMFTYFCTVLVAFIFLRFYVSTLFYVYYFPFFCYNFYHFQRFNPFFFVFLFMFFRSKLFFIIFCFTFFVLFFPPLCLSSDYITHHRCSKTNSKPSISKISLRKYQSQQSNCSVTISLSLCFAVPVSLCVIFPQAPRPGICGLPLNVYRAAVICIAVSSAAK